MNIAALYHSPQSEYSFPVSVNASVVRLRAAAGELERAAVVVRHKYDEQPIGTFAMTKRFTDTLFDYYECELPTDRGRRLYYFELTGRSGERMLYTESGAQRPEDVPDAYFPNFQIPFVSQSDVMAVPDRFKNTVIYQIFPDRFFTRKPKIDWSKRPTFSDFFGGELLGAAEKLPYIRELGMNAVYLTPVNPSHTNHHYDVEDYYRVADDLGGDEALLRFVERAHELNIKVILDGVFNHCSILNPMFADVMKNGRASRYYNWFLVDGDVPDPKRCNYQTFARKVAYMPKLNGDEPEVRAFVSDVAVHWIKKFGIDGWRLDVGDDVSPALWREVRTAVKAADGQAVMIGENWMDARAMLRGDTFDGVMNYIFMRAVRDFYAFGSIDAAGAAERLIRAYMRYPAPACDMMMNMIGSHDTHRFFTLCGEDLFRYNAAVCTLFFFDGMPTVYYGDELPMPGEHDPDCRRGFDWSRTGSETSALIKRLAGMRTAEPPGTQMRITNESGALIMERVGDKHNSLFVNLTSLPAHTSFGVIPAHTVKTVIDGKETEFS